MFFFLIKTYKTEPKYWFIHSAEISSPVSENIWDQPILKYIIATFPLPWYTVMWLWPTRSRSPYGRLLPVPVSLSESVLPWESPLAPSACTLFSRKLRVRYLPNGRAVPLNVISEMNDDVSSRTLARNEFLSLSHQLVLQRPQKKTLKETLQGKPTPQKLNGSFWRNTPVFAIHLKAWSSLEFGKCTLAVKRHLWYYVAWWNCRFHIGLFKLWEIGAACVYYIEEHYNIFLILLYKYLIQSLQNLEMNLKSHPAPM